VTTAVPSVRVNEDERALLVAALTLAATSLSDSIRLKALDAAEADILDQRIVAIPAKHWEAFGAWANRSPEEMSGLEDRFIDAWACFVGARSPPAPWPKLVSTMRLGCAARGTGRQRLCIRTPGTARRADAAANLTLLTRTAL